MHSSRSKIFQLDTVQQNAGSSLSQWVKSYQTIYIIALLGALAFLPFIQIPTTKVIPGIVHSLEGNHLISSSIPGKIIKKSLLEDQLVQEGQVLLQLDDQRIKDKIQYQKQRIRQNQIWIEGLSFSIQVAGQETILKGGRGQKVQLAYQSAKKWKKEVKKLCAENHALQNSIQQLQLEQEHYRVYSPTTGNLTQVAGVQIGHYLNPGQPLAMIPMERRLEIHCWVNYRDITYIHPGQSIAFQVDTLSRSLDGAVIQVTQQKEIIAGQTCYKVRCILDQQQLTGGPYRELQKGMTGKVRFTLDSRCIFQLLFDHFE